jgi:GTPase SAR1 family protein
MPDSDLVDSKTLRVAVVGPCSCGKSTLTKALKAAGYQARHPAQEHSYVPNMWQRISQPDLLIYLDVDYANTLARRPTTGGGPQRLAEQRHRLRHARENCDFYLDTSGLSVVEVETAVFNFLATLHS